MSQPLNLLLSLPPIMCGELSDSFPELARRAFATFDPPDSQLGSGGGTAYVLSEAWRRAEGSRAPFRDWVGGGQQVVLHGGGESRRLPAYAGVGKLFIPMPVLRWSRGQRLGQTLLDLNEPFLRKAFLQAGDSSRVMIASGDVLLRANEPMPAFTNADVVMLGMWASPEVAQNYGVMFCDRKDLTQLATFLQKPTPDEIRDRSRDRPFLIDIGVWLLSERAVNCLMAKCGWDSHKQAYRSGDAPANYDLYGEWSQHLGSEPVAPDDEVSRLSVAVAPIRGGEFYHFGTTGDVIESMYALQNVVLDQSVLGAVSSLAQPKQFVQDSHFGIPLRREENESLWVDRSHIPETWRLGKRHVLTGVPENDWKLALEDGVCLDFVPVADDKLAVRPYGYTDRFRGPVSSDATRWLERPAGQWFQNRGIDPAAAAIPPGTDLQRAALFPVLDARGVTEGFIRWLTATTATAHDAASNAHEASAAHQANAALRANDDHRAMWLNSRRVSARELGQLVNLRRVHADRVRLKQVALPAMVAHGRRSILYKLDLADAAAAYAPSAEPLPATIEDTDDVMLAVHNRMFRSEVLKCRGDMGWADEQAAATALLEQAIVEPYQREPLLPHNQLAIDQIVWARSPARIDFAGGWTDTPPFCIEQGGSVANIALNLNGQPPIQAFARRTADRAITIRSIDLGVSEQITTYEQIGGYRGVGSGFTVAKAALSLCGFHPGFNGGAFSSLAEQLDAFGGGIDLSMLAAIPKGSGLGTSSILAGTVLGALSELCGYHWDPPALAARVSAAEQMLGSGGGWQDQLGGLLPGAKLIETPPGTTQDPSVRWLPTDFFQSAEYRSRALLYYTGITRVAHDVLGEIVRGMFLNDPARLSVLAGIAENSRRCFDAVQRFDLPAFAESIDRSWRLNQSLDSGTNRPEIEAIIGRIARHTSALKLSGAGGGGFLYILAKDAEHAQQVREELQNHPPNERARFVEMSVSTEGLQVTRS